MYNTEMYRIRFIILETGFWGYTGTSFNNPEDAMKMAKMLNDADLFRYFYEIEAIK
jgi:hypothetical protein